MVFINLVKNFKHFGALPYRIFLSSNIPKALINLYTSMKRTFSEIIFL
jgi:hypothetical protein